MSEIRVDSITDEAGTSSPAFTNGLAQSDIAGALNATGTAPIYACRAWVNFNELGTVSIRGSGNVSSITDNGTGDHTINLNNALPDANGSATYGGIRDTGTFSTLSYHQQIWITSTTTVRARTGTAGTGFGDHDVVSIAVFR